MFLKPVLIKKIKDRIIYNYPSPDDEFDEETGEVIPGVLTKEQIKTVLRQKITQYALRPGEAEITFLAEIPIVTLQPDNVTPEYADADGFIIGAEAAPLGIGLVNDSDTNRALDLQHELVHLATRYHSLGSLVSVRPSCNQFGEAKNIDEIDRHALAQNFIDEALAYGTNAFAHEHEIDARFVARNLFYCTEEKIAGYDVSTNSRLWAKVLNETIADRTGRQQFQPNYYLVKKVRTLADLDLTAPEVAARVNSLWK